MKSKGSNLSSIGFVGLMVTQFLGAFNDNAFKLVIFLYIGSAITDIKIESKLEAVAAAFFIIPFILFSTYAGWVSDRFSKKRVVVKTKYAEIIVMLFGMIAFMTGSLPVIILVLFLMGAQSAFFSPAKYGILPEIVREDELSSANGYLQMFTFLAIILGTAIGGLLSANYGAEPYMPSLYFIGIAMIGAVAAQFVADVKPARENKQLEMNPVKSALWTFNNIKHSKTLLFTILAIAFFWFVGALFQLNILIYVKSMMQLEPGEQKMHIALLMTRLALGIGIGSMLAGRLSGKKVDFGLVPFGGLGMAFFCHDLSLSYGSFTRTAFDVLMLGISSGLFIIPLTTYLQQYSAADEKGENIAFSNLVSFSAILCSSGVIYLSLNVIETDSAGLFNAMSGVILFTTFAILIAIPDTLKRSFLWCYLRPRFKVRLEGRSHLPKGGGALIVCNSFSYIDAFLVSFATGRRIMFLVPEEYCRRIHLRLFYRLIRAVPVPKSGSGNLAKVLFKARRELEAGNMVCTFPEGASIGTEPLGAFDEHLIRVARAKAPKKMVSRASKSYPIIPAYLQVTSKRFSGLTRFLRARRVSITLGHRIKADASAYEVRKAVSLLSHEASRTRDRGNNLLQTAFIHTAKKRFFKSFISDSLGFDLSYGSALAATMAFSRKLKAELKQDERMVGILLPTSSIAVLMNYSVLMAGRVPVNLNYTASKDALSSAVAQCKIKKVFTTEKLLKKLKIKKSDNMVLVEEFFKDIDIVVKLIEYFKALITPAFILKLIYKNKMKGSDVATVIFSSGSTGEPKGVMLSHLNVLTNVESVREVLPLSRDEKFCGVLPFFHSFGFMATLVLPAVYGYETVYHPNPVDAAHIGKMCSENQCTLLLATPTFLSAYLRKCTPKSFKSLKLVLAGAEKLPKKTAKEFHDKFGIHPLEGLGCTELSPVISVNTPDKEAHGIKRIGGKVGSVGRPLPGVTVKVLDIETKEELGCDKEGLLFVHGPNLMKGYLNDQVQTLKVIRNGWYNTGDIATVDEDGFITVTDRLSRFSKIGGEMVPHIKVEETIQEIVDGEQKSFVVTSAPDGRKGERLVVLYTDELTMPVDELWEKLNQTALPKLWLPKKDAFKKIKAIPLLGTGKVALREVKRLAKDD